jgi:hypothetical protein
VGAIAGNHSCSPDLLLSTTLTSDWILKVAHVCATTKTGLDAAKTRDATINEWAIANLKLQFVDPEYASRAGANNWHFLIPRTSNDLSAYLAQALAVEAEPNALGLTISAPKVRLGFVHVSGAHETVCAQVSEPLEAILSSSARSKNARLRKTAPAWTSRASRAESRAPPDTRALPRRSLRSLQKLTDSLVWTCLELVKAPSKLPPRRSRRRPVHDVVPDGRTVHAGRDYCRAPTRSSH